MHLLPPEQRARLAAGVPQMPKLPSGFTVGEAVMVGRISFHGWFGPESTDDRAAVREALAAVGLEADIDCRLETLSGGAQQRMFIARALAQEAPILLMDEPTAHLDLRYQIETLTLLRRLAREKRRAVLIALHDLNLASRFADRVALMDRGRLIACGAPCEVLTADILSPLYAIRLHVFPHPLYGHPLILPDGDDQVADERERRAAG
jgi:iron complex transport system ATP-binding protein